MRIVIIALALLASTDAVAQDRLLIEWEKTGAEALDHLAVRQDELEAAVERGVAVEPVTDDQELLQAEVVARVQTTRPLKPSFTSNGIRPEWSMCACESTTLVTICGSKGRTLFLASLSFLRP